MRFIPNGPVLVVGTRAAGWLHWQVAITRLTVVTSKQPLYPHSSSGMNFTLSITIHHCVEELNHLHPRALLPLMFWSPSIHFVSARKGVVLSQSSPFGPQFMACWSFYYFLGHIAQLPLPCSSSSFPSISMTYHNIFDLETAHDWETDHPRVLFIHPNDLSDPLSLLWSLLGVDY